MTSTCILTVLAVLPWTAAGAQTPSDQISPTWKAEVDQVLETVWASIDSEDAKFARPAKPTDKAWVTQKLQHMVDIDQTVRNAFAGPKVSGWGTDAREYFSKKLAARMDKIDRANSTELKELLKIHGWFTISVFGKDADHLAWLLVQHADHDPKFQQEVLDILTGLYPKGETRPSNYAYLWDRVASHTGKKQRYGTQGRCTGPGAWEPFEIENPANVDSTRASVGLPPMAIYRQVFKDLGLCP